MDLRGAKARFTATFARVRARSRLVDHLARALAHYSAVLGSQLAAAATYFGFLSFFPLVALAFAVLGYVVAYVPEAEEAATKALAEVLPGMLGSGPGKINVQAIASRKTDVGIIGLVVLLYSGLGWVSALRTALQAVFDVVSEEKRKFIAGKAFDILVLVVVGLVLMISVGLGTAVTGFTGTVVRLLGVGHIPGAFLLVLGASILVGIGANTLVFFALYRLLPKHNVAARWVWQGALIAGIGFEVLKQAASLVIGQVTSNPLYGTFAIMVALLVWINYFDRLAVLGAAWAAVATVPSAKPLGEELAGEELAGEELAREELARETGRSTGAAPVPRGPASSTADGARRGSASMAWRGVALVGGAAAAAWLAARWRGRRDR